MSPPLARAAVWGPRPLVHRRSRFGTNAERVARALIPASILYLILLMVLAVLHPDQIADQRIVVLEDRTPKFLVPEPKFEAPPAITEVNLEQVAVRTVADVPLPEGIVPEVIPTPLRERKADPDAGSEGRKRAEEATARLASATASLDNALKDLSSSLHSSKDGVPETSRRRRARRVGAGRGEEQLAGFDAGRPATGGADLEHSGVTGSIVAIGNLAPARAEDSGSGETENRSGSAPGVYRSNASLLAVIQRYAAGIQYCYENDLNRQPGLRGKLVVALTVAASGEVLEATVVQNTLGSNRISGCALSQIRQWKFPPISGGVTSFQTPFVFTPPN